MFIHVREMQSLTGSHEQERILQSLSRKISPTQIVNDDEDFAWISQNIETVSQSAIQNEDNDCIYEPFSDRSSVTRNMPNHIPKTLLPNRSRLPSGPNRRPLAAVFPPEKKGMNKICSTYQHFSDISCGSARAIQLNVSVF